MYFRRVLILLSVVFSSFAAVLAGFDLSFNVYALILKETFDFTQTEVEIVASMGTIGLSLSFLETFATRTFGQTVTAWILTTTLPLFSISFGLIILYRDVLKFHLILNCVIQLLMSAVDCMTYVAVSRICIDLMPEKHTGKVLSFYMGLICCGKIFFGVLVDNFFNLNLSGFFFTLAILTFLTFGGSFFLLHQFVREQSQQEDSVVEVKHDDLSKPSTEKQDTSVKDMFQSPFFHGVFWTTVLFYSCGYTCLNNVTTIAESVGSKTPLYYVYVFSVTISLLRPACGVLFDKFRSETYGFIILQINFVCFLSSMIIGMFALDNSTMFLSAILYGVGFASSMPVGLSILLLRFGRTCYSPVVNIFYVVSGASQILLQILFGYFYDLKGEEQNLIRTCYGRECFFWPFLIMFLISLVTSTFQLITGVLTYIGNRKNGRQTSKS